MWFFVVILGVMAGLMDDDWPPAEAAILLAFVAYSLLRQKNARRASFATGVGILAYLYTNVYLAVLLDGSLPEDLYGKTLKVEGDVVERLQGAQGRQQLLFQVSRCAVVSFSGSEPEPKPKPKVSALDSGCRFTGHVILNRYVNSPRKEEVSVGLQHPDGLPVHLAEVGERWQFLVRLYPVRGFVNQGQSRYRLQQLAKGVMARGYVKDEGESLRLEPALQWQQWQNSWVSAFKTKADRLGLPLVATLLTGQSSALSSEHWQLLQETGTVHLVVVSGLHIGVLLGAGWFLLSLLSRLLPIDRYWLRLLFWFTPVISLMPMLMIWPSGVAVFRAMLMVVLVIFLRAQGILLSPFRVLLLIVMVLLISQPVYLLRPGFYYSIWAVFLLLMLVSGRQHSGLFFRVQMVLMAGLVPLQHYWLNTPDLVAASVNLVVVPLVSLWIFPLALISMVLPFSWLGSLLYLSESLFWQALGAGAALGLGYPEFSLGLYGLFILFALVWALPSLPGRAVTFLFLMAALLYPSWDKLASLALLDKEGLGAESFDVELFDIEIFDVGQGLSVAVTVGDQQLIYDTGPVFRSGFMPIEMVLPPRIRAEGTDIDLLVLSHDDKDHAGGLPSLLPFSRAVLAGQPDRIPQESVPVTGCYQGQRWQWSQVVMEVLYPPEALSTRENLSDNARSCVLRIYSLVDADKSLLLTGDIGLEAEQWLLNSGQNLSARWMLASHHGSAAGNSLAFLSAVSPRGIIYSAGYRNSYGHPAKKVQGRVAYLQKQRSRTSDERNGFIGEKMYREYNTADLGALRLKSSHTERGWVLFAQRESIPLRWLWQKLN